MLNTDAIIKNMINQQPFNADASHLCRIIKAQYFKGGAAPILDNTLSGAKYKATGVIISYE